MRGAVRLLALAVLAAGPPVVAEEAVDLGVVTRIRDEGFRRSHVMETAAYLTDRIGPRLTGSPAMKEANEWTRRRLEEWGLAAAHLEPYEFGRGWTFSRCALHLLRPQATPLAALPKAWTPGTDGRLRGTALRVDVKTEKDLEKYKGKLAGKLLLLDEAKTIKPPDDPIFDRLTNDELTELRSFEIPEARAGDFRRRGAERWKLARARDAFFLAEGALATVEGSSRDSGLLTVQGSNTGRDADDKPLPGVILAAEQYNRLLRLIEADQEVELELEVEARFLDTDRRAFNTIAELPGSDRRGEVVMVGAHLDSWHTGTGATDNAAGCAVVMEAVRILKALDLKLRRTVRIALWSGEEQGLLGSRAYVRDHFGSRPLSTDPEQQKLPVTLREEGWPIEVKPEHAKLAAYFNIDNGTGKVRGIYAEENSAVVPIFGSWLAPFADLGADTVTLRRTGGTDHQSFDRVGLPGFQFIQDELDYQSRTHHTHMDVYDHLRREDLIQASVVLASVLYDAATRAEPLPRKPLPQKPPPGAESERRRTPEEPADAGR
ncbi:MAG TPA: M20/M25/M40 family metallo-hydrolase [Candidatus Polarisedimenticolaceae bacterium]|nr:M20/M25/M40 family metallo-hydrolase [Candidatus Polarisedimenticolaceae bacterium]